MTPTSLDTLRGPLSDLPEAITLAPVGGPIEAVVRPPGSKSLANRALTLALLGHGEAVLENVPDEADDIRVMLEALPLLGASIDRMDSGEYRITGTNGRPTGGATLNLHNAGTATRFLTAACALADSPVVIDGDARMRQRPIGALVEALRSIGAFAEYVGEEGFPPVQVGGNDPSRWSGEVELAQTASSQFISAMLLVAPFCPNGLDVRLVGEVTSEPYVRMTEAMTGMVGMTGMTGMTGTVGAEAPCLGSFEIEPDASGAAPFLAVRAVVPGSVIKIEGIGGDSLQGDARFSQVIEGVAAGGAFDVDLADMPDTAMTLAVVACFADGVSTIRGLRTLRVKETDRIAALVTELGKVGVTVEVFEHDSPGGNPDEGIRITPPLGGGAGGIDCSAGAAPIAFETYDDHRMAMSLALIGLRRPGVTINDPACVAKTYPRFWRDFASLYSA